MKQASTDKLVVFQLLQRDGFRLGRTDPMLDPKGYRTLFLFDLAEKYYRQPGLAEKTLGDPGNPTQIFPEEQLVARLEAGQLDAGIFYRNEVVDHNLPLITFPRELNLSDPELESYYASATYVSPKGTAYHGGAIVYTITIPESSRNRDGAIAFVGFVLSGDGRKILEQHGLRLIQPVVSGEKGAVPDKLRTALEGAGLQ